MKKRYHYFSFSILVSLIFFLCAHSAKAVDECATESLGSDQQAAENCPQACAQAIKEGEFLGGKNWLPTKRGMGCMNHPSTKHNYTDSVCGCSNKNCCYTCNVAAIGCDNGCNGIPPGVTQAVCLTGCVVAWNFCNQECGGGCPSQEKEALNEEKTESLKHEKSPVEEKVPDAKESSKVTEPLKEDAHQKASKSAW